MTRLQLIHIQEVKKLGIYQVFGLGDLRMQELLIELLMKLKKIWLFLYCYVEPMKISMSS